VEYWREYRRLKVSTLTHDQYLAEPTHITDWLIAIDGMEAEVRSEKERDAIRG
jgi:hypothetical protein